MDLFDWQDYENYTIPENADKRGVFVTLSENKPDKNEYGFYIDTSFDYRKPNNGEKLWIKFKEVI